MSEPALYYDPYDIEIDADPYPVWRRLREEAPLYYNEKHDFYAVSRFADVEAGLKDSDTYSSGRGAILELIKAASRCRRASSSSRTRPSTTIHRGLLRGCSRRKK